MVVSPEKKKKKKTAECTLKDVKCFFFCSLFFNLYCFFWIYFLGISPSHSLPLSPDCIRIDCNLSKWFFAFLWLYLYFSADCINSLLFNVSLINVFAVMHLSQSIQSHLFCEALFTPALFLTSDCYLSLSSLPFFLINPLWLYNTLSYHLRYLFCLWDHTRIFLFNFMI